MVVKGQVLLSSLCDIMSLFLVLAWDGHLSFCILKTDSTPDNGVCIVELLQVMFHDG